MQKSRQTKRMRAANPQRDREIKDRIVAAAEHVFAEVGTEKATLRDITARAKVNVAAVSYYFGSKSDLVLSVFSELSARIADQRIRDLDACLALAKQQGTPPQLRSVLDVFIRPYLDGKSGRLFARLILQHRIAPSEVTNEIMSAHFDPMARRFIQAIAEACPDIDAKVFFWRYFFMIGSVVYSTADLGALDRAGALSEGRVWAPEAADLHTALLDFIVAGMRHDPAGASEFPAPSQIKSATKRRQR